MIYFILSKIQIQLLGTVLLVWVSQSVSDSTLSSDIFSNQMCDEKTSSRALTFEWVLQRKAHFWLFKRQPFSWSILKYKLTRTAHSFIHACPAETKCGAKPEKCM